ncbi:MAG: C4-dicarboxylate ABC transporter permease, partial [Rhodospirillaceae bacterium]|nr:C4-dicarboxylate ABC transporter permease [Rhodospirillaceae bacterium]
MLSFLGMLTLIAVHVPVGIAMAIAGVVGFAIMTGDPLAAISMFGSETASAISSPALIIIPMFRLMGAFAW